MIPHRATWTRAMEFSLGNITHPGGRGEVSMFPMFHFAGWHFLLGPWAFRRAAHLGANRDPVQEPRGQVEESAAPA